MPDGVRALEYQVGSAPRTRLQSLELFILVSGDPGRLRLAPPLQRSWLQNGSRWMPLRSAEVRQLLLIHRHSRVAARLLLTERGAPSKVVAKLAWTEEPQLLATVAAWLGWPDISRRDGDWPRTLSEALAIRSNDYWPIDLAAQWLNIGDLCRGRVRHQVGPSGLSVVVAARGAEDVLPGALAAIVESARHLTDRSPWECLVIDDANDPPLRLPFGLPDEVRVVRSHRRLHCGGARNLGLTTARYRLVVFCDADTHIAENYLAEHCIRHALTPNLITISLREHVIAGDPVPDRLPIPNRDTRIVAKYEPGRLGLVEVSGPIVVHPLARTRDFRDFGYGRLLGPVDLPFMVKGNNLAVDAEFARSIGFPPDFVGWGPEDVCFAAKCIARGAWVVPVLSTGVFHRDHLPRSGSNEQRDKELVANLIRYSRHLGKPVDGGWASEVFP